MAPESRRAARAFLIRTVSGSDPAAEFFLNLSEQLAGSSRADMPSAQRSQPPVCSPPTLDLLMDVELPVSVSFGRAQLQIKDVLEALVRIHRRTEPQRL